MGISGLNTPAHTFARLRIARAVVAAGARLATDLPGSALVGSVSHRLDDDSEFQGSIVSPFLSDQHCLVALAISFSPPTAPTTVNRLLAANEGIDRLRVCQSDG